MSRLSPATFNGTGVCPSQMSFGMVHGSSAAIGSVKFEDETVNMRAGEVVTLGIGGAQYVGFVQMVNHSQTVEGGESTSIRFVDWRDTLHDYHFYGAYNMQEADGRVWHMFPEDWELDRKTWLTKEIDQADFKDFQDAKAGVVKGIGQEKILSAASILNILGKEFSFQWKAEDTAGKALKSAYPLNMDWMSGVRAIECVNSLLSKIGLQFTCFGKRKMLITIRGFSSDAFVQRFLSGSASICALGAISGSLGDEINTRGQRVAVLGSASKHEMVFPCIANWNPKWEFNLSSESAFDFSAFLIKHKVTTFSKVSELPEEYHDSEPWTENNTEVGEGAGTQKTRNDMTIQEYMDQVVWKVYKVCFDYLCDGSNLKTSVKDVRDGTELAKIGKDGLEKAITDPEKEFPDQFDIGPLVMRRQDRELGKDTYYSKFRIADTLVSESNARYILYATTTKLVQGTVSSPAAKQRAYVPIASGHSMSPEEFTLIENKKGRSAYRVYVKFNKKQYFVEEENGEFTAKEDIPFIRLALEGPKFKYEQGAAKDSGPRIREIKRTFPGLHKAYVNGKKKRVLRENLLKAPDGNENKIQAAQRPVNADSVAEAVADKLLFHSAITRSGHLEFEDKAGLVADGMISTINITYSNTEGIKERVNFTTGILDDDTTNGVILQAVSSRLKFDEDIKIENLDREARLIMFKASPIIAKAASLIQDVTGSFDWSETAAWARKFGQEGMSRVKANKEILEHYETYSILPLDEPEPDDYELELVDLGPDLSEIPPDSESD